MTTEPVDPKQLLAPLDAEREAIRQLTGYATPAELGSALQRVSAAVDQVLRRMLRGERGVLDAARLGALSDAQSAREVVVTLRGADTITMQLAAGVESLREAAERAATGGVTAADADVAQEVLHRLMDTIAGAGERAPAAAAAVAQAASHPPPSRGSDRVRMRTWAPAILVVVFGGVFAWMSFRDTAPTGRAAADAFAAGRLGEAEALFRLRVTAGNADVVDWLYLGRIYRRTGRPEEAAASLRTAVDADPEDADVRRELGWLFMDLDRPSAAREQFALAVERVPDDPLNWVGLVRAMRAADDPAAEDWLARAPREAQERLTGGADRPPRD